VGITPLCRSFVSSVLPGGGHHDSIAPHWLLSPFPPGTRMWWCPLSVEHLTPFPLFFPKTPLPFGSRAGCVFFSYNLILSYWILSPPPAVEKKISSGGGDPLFTLFSWCARGLSIFPPAVSALSSPSDSSSVLFLLSKKFVIRREGGGALIHLLFSFSSFGSLCCMTGE